MSKNPGKFQNSKPGGYQQNRGPQQSGNRGPQQSGYRGPQSGAQSRGGGGFRSSNAPQQPEDPSLSLPIQTIDAVDNVKRKWVGTRGAQCDLIVNYFNVNIKSNKLFRFYVDIQFPKRDKDETKQPKKSEAQSEDEKAKERQVKNRMTLRKALWECLKRNVNREKKFHFVYDDKSILFSTFDFLGERDELDDEFDITDPNFNEQIHIHVKIRTKSVVSMDMQALNLILTQLARHPFGPLKDDVYCEIDRRFIRPKPGFEPLPIERCLELLRGLNSAAKNGPGKLMLANYDLKHSTFLKPEIGVLEFYALCKRIQLPSDLSQLTDMSLNQNQRSELNGFLHGMLLHPTYGNMHRNQRFVKVHNKTARTATFQKDGNTLTVEQYLAQAHNIRLKLPNLPLIQVGKTDRGIFIPMELLKIADKRQRVRQKLPDDLQALTTAYTTVKPLARFNIIRKMMEECKVGNDEIASAFGVSVDMKFLKIKGRNLPEVPVQHCVKIQKPFGKTIDIKLAVVNVNNAMRDEAEIRQKMNELATSCSKFGLRFTSTDVVRLDLRNERNIRGWLTSLKNKLGPNSLALFIIDDRDKNFYDQLKHDSDLKVGLRTQVVKKRTFLKIGNFTLNANLFRKMNNKVGGVNMKVDKNCWTDFTKKPTLFFGVDVTHPAPGDSEFLSVAAAVGNLDIDGAEYGATVRIQRSRCEEVLDIGNMFAERARAFKSKTGKYPDQVMYFRDGVADSQFEMVVGAELNSMKRACKKLNIDPKFTVLIVQKRHCTRFYAKDGGDQNGNVKPGTVVDRFITNEETKQFFMASHKGLLGTSKPINYFVIYDDSNWNADSVQNCANLLCNLFGRAAGPVSLPAPVYYAHLVCFRARSYVNYLRNNNEQIDNLGDEAFNAHQNIIENMYFS